MFPSSWGPTHGFPPSLSFEEEETEAWAAVGTQDHVEAVVEMTQFMFVCAAVPGEGWGWLLTLGLHPPRASPSSS